MLGVCMIWYQTKQILYEALCPNLVRQGKEKQFSLQ